MVATRQCYMSSSSGCPAASSNLLRNSWTHEKYVIADQRGVEVETNINMVPATSRPISLKLSKSPKISSPELSSRKARPAQRGGPAASPKCQLLRRVLLLRTTSRLKMSQSIWANATRSSPMALSALDLSPTLLLALQYNSARPTSNRSRRKSRTHFMTSSAEPLVCKLRWSQTYSTTSSICRATWNIATCALSPVIRWKMRRSRPSTRKSLHSCPRLTRQLRAASTR